MKIGELMISNGAAAADVTATMLRVTASSGIRNVSVQVTLTEVSVSYLPDSESTPFTRIRSASGYVLNYAKLDACDDIADDYVQGRIELHDARAAVERLQARGRHYSTLMTTAGWFVLGGACALFFGGSSLVVVFAAITAALLANLMDVLGKLGLPGFYTQIFGGFFSVLMALLVHWIDPSVNSSLVVVACIILLLAGLTSVGAIQDAITGWYVTAAARLLETFVLTIGIVIGIRAGMLAADLMGADISITSALPATLVSVLVIAVASAVIGFGYSIGVQVPPRLLVWTTLISAATGTVSFALGTLGMDRPWAVGLTSIVAGFASVMLAQRLGTPAMILVAAGVIPMVPGAVIYRGLLALGDDSANGWSTLFTAAEIAIAISTGIILGEFLAARLLARLPQRSASRGPVITAPFSTNKRRRMVSLGGRRKPSPVTTAIPVVHLDPGELDPTIDWSEGPAWRGDLANLQPEATDEAEPGTTGSDSVEPGGAEVNDAGADAGFSDQSPPSARP